MTITIKPSQDFLRLIASFPYSPVEVDLVKDVLHAQAAYKEIKVGNSVLKKFSHWELIPDEETRELLNSIKDDPRFAITPRTWAMFESFKEWKEENYRLSSASSFDLEVSGLGGNLRNFQRATVRYIFNNARGVLNGDEMGLGKTVEALAAVEYSGHYPLLVVCPAIVKYDWFKACVRWLPGRSVKVIGAYKKESLDMYTDITIINYDILEKHFDYLNSWEFQTVVFDESHYLKNYQAQRTKLAIQLSQYIPHRILLSGTPILNRPKELISQLQIMDRLNEFGGFWPFVNRYCAAFQQIVGGKLVLNLDGAANLDELNKRLRETCYVRHEKKEVLKDLPEKTRIPLWVRITNGPDYEKAESDLIVYLKENATIPAEVIQQAEERAEFYYVKHMSEEKINRGEAAISKEADELKEAILQNYRDSVAYKASKAEAIVKIGVLKQLVARGKIQAAESWIRNFFEQKDSLVVFCWHTYVIEELTKYFSSTVKTESITGSQTPEEKSRIVESFQMGQTKLLICNIQAGGVGITLTAADTALFLELGWNPGTMDQAEDRIYRMGQKNATTIYYMLGESTIELAIWNMIEKKRNITASALDGFETVKEYLLATKRRDV